MAYASAHQLSSEATTPSSYVWQPAASGTDTYAAVNNLNQYTSWTPSGGTAKSFSYDGNGNTTAMTASGVGWTFAYDPENRLLTANKAAGGVAAAYAYDPLGRRNHKSGVGVTETYFVDDSTDEIAEYNASGALSLRYVPGPAINQPIASISSSGARRFIQTDRHGSVIAVATNNGTQSEGPYVYDSYGNGAPTTGIAYKYVGMRLDPETGLYYDRARYYCSTCGRFLQPDPVGYAADLNLYPYTNNDPTNKVDPNGEYAWRCDVVFKNGVAQAATCVVTNQDPGDTTVTYFLHYTYVDQFGQSTSSEAQTTAVYKRNLYNDFFNGGDQKAINDQLSLFFGNHVDFSPIKDFPNIAPVAMALSGPAMKKLGNLVNRAQERAGDVARSRGASGANIREMGPWAEKTLGETAEASVEGDRTAETAIKIVKQAARLGQKH